MPVISPELAARLRGDYREDICERLWAQVPAALRLTCFDRESTAGHPGFSWNARFPRLDLARLPEPMQRELAWCVWRAVEQGGQIHHAYANLVRRLVDVLEDDHAAGRALAGSLVERPLADWERAMGKPRCGAACGCRG